MSSDSPAPLAVISPAAAGRRSPASPNNTKPLRPGSRCTDGCRAWQEGWREQLATTTGHNKTLPMLHRIPAPSAPERRNAAGQA